MYSHVSFQFILRLPALLNNSMMRSFITIYVSQLCVYFLYLLFKRAFHHFWCNTLLHSHYSML